ncbi:MAG: hypothetical protein JXB49_26160 [Bacteroidales bacterium]|nr:hypothetical protein [Bacteroidales bacterium]
MKRIGITLLGLLFISAMYSQKPNTKDILFLYTQPPSKPLNDNINTFFPKVTNTGSSDLVLPDNISSTINLIGYVKASSEKSSDISIHFKINSITNVSTTEDVKYKQKMKDGTTVEKTGGIFKITAKLSYGYAVEDLKNKKTISSIENKTVEKTYSSSQYPSPNEATEAMKRLGPEKVKELHLELIYQELNIINVKINDDYGYPKERILFPIARGKGKDLDYSDLENTFNTLEKTSELYNAEGLTSDIKETFNQCLIVWDKAIGEYVPNSKKARIGDKIIAELYFNKACIYFLLNDWENSYGSLSKSTSYDGPKYMIENFTERIKNQEERYKLSSSSLSPERVKEIQTLNHSIIYDLFVNYELTEKNGNLATIIDFFPALTDDKYKSVKLNSNVGGDDQVCNFIFNDNGNIEKFIYEINGKYAQYDFIYEGSLLTGINIAGKPKVSFAYSRTGQLISITREKNGASFVYNFDYIKGENKANIKLIVIQEEKARASTQNYYVTWDTGFKIESYCFDVYCNDNLKYNSKGDLLSFSFTNVSADNNDSAWDYSKVDAKQNWTERNSEDIVFTRMIEYK